MASGSDRFGDDPPAIATAIIELGWLDEFLEKCWRFPTGNLA